MWGYVDSDYGGDRDNGMSITWYIFTVGGTTVSWIYQLQKIVVLSSIKAEYMAAEASKEFTWV